MFIPLGQDGAAMLHVGLCSVRCNIKSPAVFHLSMTGFTSQPVRDHIREIGESREDRTKGLDGTRQTRVKTERAEDVDRHSPSQIPG